ncbi:MAG: hypothetical protein ACRC8K_19000 [Waterburya sp.]
MVERLQAKDIKPRLNSLIAEAETVNQSLASRLRQISRWVKDTKPGSLMKKKELLFFLIELIEDVEFWLDLSQLESEEYKLLINELNPTDRYWYTTLFPQWFEQYDPKFTTWKQKLMAGEFQAKDSQFLNLLSDNLKKRGGSVLWRYICDLSMATDLIVSSMGDKPLCVQLTVTNDSLLDTKKTNWKTTVQQWKIARAYFLSYNPVTRTGNELEIINRLCNYILDKAQILPDNCYIEDSID